MRVYIAGPYASDPLAHTMVAIAAGNAVMDLGHEPFVPHLCHFWHAETPRHYEDWMRVDLAFVEVCDALIRLPGHSPGADREVEHACKFGIPVFTSVEAFESYVAARKLAEQRCRFYELMNLVAD